MPLPAAHAQAIRQADRAAACLTCNWQINAFTNNPACGNPAAVCLIDDTIGHLDDATCQAIALKNNLSETAFIETVSNYQRYCPITAGGGHTGAVSAALDRKAMRKVQLSVADNLDQITSEVARHAAGGELGALWYSEAAQVLLLYRLTCCNRRCTLFSAGRHAGSAGARVFRDLQ